VGEVLSHLAEGAWWSAAGQRDGVGRAVRLAQLAQRFDEQEVGGQPDGAAPVGVSSLDLANCFRRLVANESPVEFKWVLFVILRQAADAELREEFVWVPDARQQAEDLLGVDDGEELCPVAGVVDGVDDVFNEVLAVLEKPVDVGVEVLERLDPRHLQTLDGEERDEADQGANAELAKIAVGVAEDVVKEA